MSRISIALGLLLLASTTEAGWLGWARRTERPPQALDSPIIRPKVQEAHKQGHRVGRHSVKYLRWEWGREQILIKPAPGHFDHFLK